MLIKFESICEKRISTKVQLIFVLTSLAVSNKCPKFKIAIFFHCAVVCSMLRAVPIATISLLRNSAHSQAKYIPFKDIIIIPSPLKACAKKEIHMGASIVESSLPTDKRFFVSPQGKIDPYLFPHPSIVYSNWRW